MDFGLTRNQYKNQLKLLNLLPISVFIQLINLWHISKLIDEGTMHINLSVKIDEQANTSDL